MSLFGSVGGAAATASNNTSGDISKDVPLNLPPEDSISDIRFSPASEHLAVSSWDKKVRIYEVNEQGQSEGKALFEHEAPVLNCCWSPVSGGICSLVFCEEEVPFADSNSLSDICIYIGRYQSRRSRSRQSRSSTRSRRQRNVTSPSRRPRCPHQSLPYVP